MKFVALNLMYYCRVAVFNGVVSASHDLFVCIYSILRRPSTETYVAIKVRKIKKGQIWKNFDFWV